jgi:hypothetical protein
MAGWERPSFHGITALSKRSFCRAEAAFLMTECSQETFAFTAHFSRRVEAGFTAGQVSSDGGALLLREADRKINLLGRLAACFTDGRSPLLVKHRLSEMLAQRIYGLALGYEDLNDHEQLRSDPLLAVLSGKRDLDETSGRQEHAEPAGTGWPQGPLSQDRLLGRSSGPAAGGSVSSSRTPRRRVRSCWTWTRPTSRFTAISRSASSTATTTATAICPCTSSRATSCCARGCGRPTRTRPQGAVEEVKRIVAQLRQRWPKR